jgi:hypothetical protein
VKKQVKYLFLSCALLWVTGAHPQLPQGTKPGINTTLLFQSEEKLPLKLRYSQKDLRNLTNDSTYLNTTLWYQDTPGSWKNLEVKIRSRGNYRLKNCYFPPVKIKLKKSLTLGTMFEGHKELKLVLPCLLQKVNNDLILKEYMAYKFFETLSPYHYKTRLVDILFEEEKGKSLREHLLKGILIEDIDNVADRHGGSQLKRSVHPLMQDNLCSVKNDFFQFMIGNTDYSIAYQHNEKLLFIDKKTIPVPYDFDMSGLVDASYAVVSKIQDEDLSITDVTQRLYRGFRRNPAVYQMVREEYLEQKQAIFEVMDFYKYEFKDAEEFNRARHFITGFYSVLENDGSFSREILAQARIR